MKNKSKLKKTQKHKIFFDKNRLNTKNLKNTMNI